MADINFSVFEHDGYIPSATNLSNSQNASSVAHTTNIPNSGFAATTPTFQDTSIMVDAKFIPVSGLVSSATNGSNNGSATTVASATTATLVTDSTINLTAAIAMYVTNFPAAGSGATFVTDLANATDILGHISVTDTLTMADDNSHTTVEIPAPLTATQVMIENKVAIEETILIDGAEKATENTYARGAEAEAENTQSADSKEEATNIAAIAYVEDTANLGTGDQSIIQGESGKALATLRKNVLKTGGYKNQGIRRPGENGHGNFESKGVSKKMRLLARHPKESPKNVGHGINMIKEVLGKMEINVRPGKEPGNLGHDKYGGREQMKRFKIGRLINNGRKGRKRHEVEGSQTVYDLATGLAKHGNRGLLRHQVKVTKKGNRARGKAEQGNRGGHGKKKVKVGQLENNKKEGMETRRNKSHGQHGVSGAGFAPVRRGMGAHQIEGHSGNGDKDDHFEYGINSRDKMNGIEDYGVILK
jgi:hypothetical protein